MEDTKRDGHPRIHTRNVALDRQHVDTVIGLDKSFQWPIAINSLLRFTPKTLIGNQGSEGACRPHGP